MDLAPGRRGRAAVRSSRASSCRGRGRRTCHVERHRVFAKHDVPRGDGFEDSPSTSRDAVVRLRNMAWKQWASATRKDADFDAEERVRTNVSALMKWLDRSEGV